MFTVAASKCSLLCSLLLHLNVHCCVHCSCVRVFTVVFTVAASECSLLCSRLCSLWLLLGVHCSVHCCVHGCVHCGCFQVFTVLFTVAASEYSLLCSLFLLFQSQAGRSVIMLLPDRRTGLTTPTIEDVQNLLLMADRWGRGELGGRRGACSVPVSYTHLTLPTKLSV